MSPLLRLLTLILAGSAAATVHGESFSVLGRTISYSPPSGFCTPGTSATELAFTERAKATMPATSRLMYWSAACEEVAQLRAGKRDTLTEWLQIQVISADTQLKLLNMSRESFLAGISKHSPKVKIEDIQRNLQRSLADPNLVYKAHDVQTLGRDGNAVYLVMSGTVATSQGEFRFRGTAAMTLVNSVPLLIAVYGKPEVKPQRLAAIQRELLTNILTSN